MLAEGRFGVLRRQQNFSVSAMTSHGDLFARVDRGAIELIDRRVDLEDDSYISLQSGYLWGFASVG